MVQVIRAVAHAIRAEGAAAANGLSQQGTWQRAPSRTNFSPSSFVGISPTRFGLNMKERMQSSRSATALRGVGQEAEPMCVHIVHACRVRGSGARGSATN